MKKVLIGTIGLMALTACASDGYGYGGGGGRWYGGGDVAYYDGGYGPYYDGYWGDGGVYYYRSSRDGRYVRDDGHHFRRDRADGYREYRGRRGRQWR